ncbi:type II toxin-antitoxin system HicB family antitoxin [Aureimonas sp. Leaf460]|uniref:type II toxin-antitoxin system HicB family antitoxin n=2 Tax=unclassified Aureimonas TaxID=2615206 RepID=UPI001FCCF535|nr:type II toxin-antitoxin system HicB family antitoxin [Aureimonas sp. Leaf460]
MPVGIGQAGESRSASGGIGGMKTAVIGRHGVGRMASEHRFTINLQPEPEGGYTVRVPAFPEIVSYGLTLEESMANAREAIELMIEDYREDGRDIPADVPTRIEQLTVAA